MSQEQALQLRHTYLSCLKLARETDSKKEDAYLKKEAADALTELRKVCNHQDTVSLCDEYDGSYSRDYDDHHAAHRICLCCGTEEYSYDDKWKVLTNSPFARAGSKPPAQLKNPLNYLLTEVRELAETKGFPYFEKVRWK